MPDALSLNQVARLLNIASYRITYALSTGAIPEPKTRFINRRIFAADDIKRIAQHFGVTYSVPSQTQEDTP